MSLSSREAAAVLGVGIEFFEQHVLPALRTNHVEGCCLISTAELQRWLDGDRQEQVLTLAEAAERMRVSERTVLRAIRSGDLAASQLNRRGGWRIYESALTAWMDLRRTRPSTAQPAPDTRPVSAVPATARRRGPRQDGRLVP